MSDAPKQAQPAKPAKPGWFHGAAIDFSKRFRIVAFFLLLLLSASLCYSQLGIMSWGDTVSGAAINFMFFLIPVALAIVILGVVQGVGLAFITGVLIMLRAWWTPITVYDFNLSDTFLSVGGITLAAILMAAIVTLAARRWPADLSYGTETRARLHPARIASIVLGCLVFAFAFSYFTRGLIYLVITPGGSEYNYATQIQEYLATLSGPYVLLEALVNAFILSAACLTAVIYDANRRAHSLKGNLSPAFNRWLALILLFVFTISSSVSFCVETTRALNEAEEKVMGELNHLQQQVEAAEQLGKPLDSVAANFTTAYGGEVVIVHDGVVVSTNSPDMLGNSAYDILSSGNTNNYDFLINLAADHMLMGSDDDDNFEGIRALVSDDYHYLESIPLGVLFQPRTATLVYNAGFMLVMLVVVFIATRLLLTRTVVAPIRRTNDTLGLITEGELQRRVDEGNITEFNELAQGINTTVGALKDMMDEVEARNEQDLVAAKAIQESALPREFPPFPDIDRFDIYASMKTAKAVGGDFYDFFLIEDGKLAFLIADVAGKGIPAALFMMTSKTQLRNYLEAGLPVDEAVSAANHQLCLGNDAGMFVTCWVGVLDYRTGQLEYVNAGHNPPVRHGACDDGSGAWQWMREVSGMPLGLFDGMPYTKQNLLLAPGDALYLYTDGVTEAMDVEGNLFTEDRLLKTLNRFTGENARTISVGIRRAITDFTLDAEQSDDITMLTLRYGVPPESRASMTLPADVNQLVHVYNFIHEELRRRGAPKSVYNPLDIAAEELFVNVCHYAYPDDTPDDLGEVRIEFEYAPNPPSLSVSIIDDGIPYNPLAKPDAVTPDDIMEVPIGGLGILMAKNSVDDMTYERVDGSNILTFRKNW